jgi:cathepsin B
MKFILIVLMLLSAAFASHPVNKEIVEKIKQSTTQWWPSDPENNVFYNHTKEQFTAMLGTNTDVKRDIKVTLETGLFNKNVESLEVIPIQFDSRNQWGDICSFRIKDQGECGSSWAFGAVESLKDRICIRSKGFYRDLDLSEQNIVACASANTGCSGGSTLNAFRYLSEFGVPTEKCQAYTAGKSGHAYGCTTTCDDPDVFDKKYRCESLWYDTSTDGIKAEIKANGPVETTMLVYEDLVNYYGGIYTHVAGELLGSHGIKIVGWGIRETSKYWIAANSWGYSWGESGYFNIEIGTSSFGESAYSCTPFYY